MIKTIDNISTLLISKERWAANRHMAYLFFTRITEATWCPWKFVSKQGATTEMILEGSYHQQVHSRSGKSHITASKG